MGADLEPQLCRIRFDELVDCVRRERALEGRRSFPQLRMRRGRAIARRLRLFMPLAAVVFDRPEQRAVLVVAVTGGVEVIVDQRVGPGMQRQKPRLLALALDSAGDACGSDAE